MMYTRLKTYAESNPPIRVGLVGAGAMGVGIAWQLGRTPGMELTAICDRDPAAAHKAIAAYASTDSKNADIPIYSDREFLSAESNYDVLVEATNSIGFAAEACELAIRAGKHVVLMNAEVDLALGPWLHAIAVEHGVVMTSDAGDQHGVLLRMIDEIRLWDFRIVMAGNIKGFLNRYATAKSLEYEARIRRLNPIQCCAYTDGTKLNVEMALVANATGMIPSQPGMEGPTAKDVLEVLHKFEFHKYPASGVVDYILGAQPGGGVFVVGHCDDPLQTPYLHYYKLGDGPYYLFYRPYHLCHLETPWAIAAAFLDGTALAAPRAGRICDVYAYAKRSLLAGDTIQHAIGGDACYGMIDKCPRSSMPDEFVPLALLETGGVPGEQRPRLKRDVSRDQALRWSDLEVVPTPLMTTFHQRIRSLPIDGLSVAGKDPA